MVSFSQQKNKKFIMKFFILTTTKIKVNAQNKTGKTALHLAAFHGKIKLIKELRNSNASYDLKDKSGSSVLHYAGI